MKTTIRYSFIILTLGLFSSCAEQFREIRGSENRGNAFLGGGLTSSTATKHTDKAKSETVTPQQTVINEEQAAAEPVTAVTTEPNFTKSKVEIAETNQTSVIQGQKSSVSGKGKKGQFHSLKKTKLANPVKILKKAISQRGNGKEVNGYLIALGILGILGSVIGILTALWGYLWTEELIFAGFGVLFLLSLISSIWLIASPNLEDAKALKIIAIVIAAVPLFLILIWFFSIFI